MSSGVVDNPMPPTDIPLSDIKIIPPPSKDESYDLIRLVGKFGGKLTPQELRSTNNAISRKNLSKYPGGPVLSENEILELEKEYSLQHVVVPTVPTVPK